jgi:polyferredoxin
MGLVNLPMRIRPGGLIALGAFLGRAAFWRRVVQYGFLAVTVWIGYTFTLFVAAARQGVDPPFARPPGVEAFLPISSLMSLKYWLTTGSFSMVHPAGLVIFLVILLSAVLLKKGFCSWVCPVGLLSEQLEAAHRLVFRRRLTVPGWLDWPLRSLKYLLALFFIWAIVVQMSPAAIGRFLEAPYNRVADIKMLEFFARITPTALTVLIVLFVLSILIPYFWCRYLCPYGALLGLLSIVSPLKIRRTARTCTDCRACTKACPAALSVHRLASVSSDECHACLKCIDVCPVSETLELRPPASRRRVPVWAYALLIAGLFILGSGAARLTGYWQNSITLDEYRYHMEHLEEYSHARGVPPPE